MSSCRLYSPDHKGVVFPNWKVAGSIPWYSKYFARIRLVFVASERVIMDFFIYGRNCCQIFLVICPHEAGTWDPNYTPKVDFLDHDFL